MHQRKLRKLYPWNQGLRRHELQGMWFYGKLGSPRSLRWGCERKPDLQWGRRVRLDLQHRLRRLHIGSRVRDQPQQPRNLWVLYQRMRDHERNAHL